MKRQEETTFFDHFLVLVACSTSLFALGQSLIKPVLATVLAAACIVSLLVGYGVSRAVRRTKFVNYDGYLWTGIAFLSAVFSRPLNGLLPEEGFPFLLFAGAWLSWMVILCGLVSWRDQTLLFLNIPCISIFALVGTFDTYPPATVLFFLFLVCSSLLYARIHRRSMIKRAQTAGVEDPRLLQRDVWRWMAGPEWALASAGVIVLVSLLGAPVLRFSLQTVAGAVKVNIPQPTAPVSPAAVAQANNDLLLGRGPVNLSDEPYFKAKLDRPEYLRTGIFTVYSGNGWSRIQQSDMMMWNNLQARMRGANPGDRDPDGTIRAWPEGVPFEVVPDPEIAEAGILALDQELPIIPSPGPVVELKDAPPGDYMFVANGLVFRRGGFYGSHSVRVRYARPRQGAEPGNAVLPPELRPIKRFFTTQNNVSRRVVEFAVSAVQGARSDYEKAVRLQKAIERTCGYTLNSPALKMDGDTVGQFLFESRRGYCDMFASSMAVAARAVGLPSRYVTGFVVNKAERDDDGYFTLREKDSHAWAEVYFEGQGWVVFDPTEGAVPLDDNDEALKNSIWNQPWTPYAAFAVLISIVGGAAYIVSRKRGPVAAAAMAPLRQQARALHAEFDRTVRRKTRVTRRFSQTTSEYLATVGSLLGDAKPLAQQLVPTLERAVFGRSELSTEEEAEVKRLLKALKRAPVDSE